VDWWQRGFRFFDAPVAIIISVDRRFSVAQTQFDIGLVSQTICLSALHHGLGTCIVRQGVSYPDIIRKFTDIPESRSIVIGIALGYPDQNHPANKLETIREPIDNITTWHGFD
jgi:nitroreductase